MVSDEYDYRYLKDLHIQFAKISALPISVGDCLFWDGTNKVVKKTVTAQTCVGVAANPSAIAPTKLAASTPSGT